MAGRAGTRLRLSLVAFCLAAIAALAGVLRAENRDPVHSETLYVFGTLVEVVIYGEPPQKAEAATAELGRMFQSFHRDWHAWRPGELGRLNDAIASGTSLPVDDELAAVLRQGQALSLQSGGLFDPAIGKLIGLWGFHDDVPPSGPLPDREAIARLAAAQPRMADLRFDGNIVSSRNPAVQLDLGGFAKGSALDLAAATLSRRGIRNAVLNAGGDVLVIGTHGAREWRVAIRDPFGWGAVAALSVHPGEAVFTSGNYERFLEQDGVRFSHIIDPRSGWPVTDIVSATVLDTNGARADAAATALCVAGPDGMAATARAMGADAVLLIDRNGTFYATPAMAARLQAASDAGEERPLPQMVIVPLQGDAAIN
ncbi:FAD:protein FMN transferase [Tropicimonas sp. IMCC34043]|uniref:FAD:protein FMN transferase n=1 Tax=Tropicimonas sp. IMCC34043 TaxID=2248760 RepID=UPI000E235753|nr:FAD:protein FMN transferase [Tropicimonas sp. IMCC34043]